MARDLLAWPAYAHPRRAPPRHALPIRPAGRPRATDHPIAARPPHCRSNVISYSLKVEPAQHFINWQQDPFANYQARLVFPEKTREFKVTVDLVVEMAVYNPFDFFLEPEAENIPFNYSSDVQQELAPYLATDPMTPLVQAYLDKVDRSKQRTIDFLVKLNQQVSQDIRYLIRMEPGVQTPEETLQKASGSCRDSGWLLVQLLRQLGAGAAWTRPRWSSATRCA